MSNGPTRPGVFRAIWQNFLRTTFGAGKRVVVGKDQYGNIYYVFDGETRKATNRGYIPSSSSKWERMPVEWEAWLRGRRLEPPTQEEIDRNAAITETARQRGIELEKQYELERLREAKQGEKDVLETRQKQGFTVQETHDQTLKRTSVPGIKSSNVPGMPGEKTKQYPSHKEYEGYPGEEPKERKD